MSKLDEILDNSFLRNQSFAKENLKYLFRHIQLEVESEALKKDLGASERVDLFVKKLEEL